MVNNSLSPLLRALPLAALLIVAALTTAPAQNLPQITIQPWTEIAPGIRWTQATATSPRWQIRLIEADLANRNVDLECLVRAGTSNQTLSTLAASNPGVIAAINGGYFSATDSVSHVRRDGVTLCQNIGSRPPRATFGLTHHGSGPNTLDLRINRLDSSGAPTTPANDATWNRILDAIGGGPNLLTAGNLDITTVTEGFDAASGVQPDTRQPRTALGIRSAERKVFFMTVDGRQTGWSDGMTVTELARFFQDLGCDAAMNLDGGGSTTAWVNGTVVNRPSNTGNVERAIYGGWGVVPRIVVDDTDSAEVVMTPTAWDVSADAGFYNTGSRIRSGGLTGTITFRPNLARAGNYRVEARWVSAGNRATNASFTVTHRVGSTTVTVDQTQYGGQWRLLGTFDFNSGTAGSVSLASDTANGFVSADAVRWTYMGPPVGPPPGFVAARTNDFATPAGWNASGQVGSLLTPDIGSRAHDPINGALTAIVGASPRARIIGWIEDPETDLPYSAVGAGNYVRAKFSIAYSGPGNSADLALANRVPNFRLGLRTRGVVNTQLEVNHNAQTGGSPVQLPVTRELGPSKDLSAPSVYRVDLDPLEVPYLVQSTTEGIQRTFESLVSGADYSIVSGTLLLVDSVLGTYPVPPAVGAAKVLGTGGVSGNANFDNPGVLLTTLSVPTEQIVRYLTGPNPADYFNPAIVSVTVGESAISLTKSTNGIAVNTTSLPTSRIAVAEAAFIRGTVLDTGATRLRIEPDRLYELTFRVRHGGASSSCPYLRLNLRTVGFGYNVTYELLGGRGLPGPDARTFLAQVLPGNGNLVPGTTADGTTYRMLLNTPLAPDLRADVSGTIAQKFPQLSAQAGPGNPQNDPSLRDLNWGFTVVDSLSLASPSQTDFAEAATDLVLNRIELRTYPQILD